MALPKFRGIIYLTVDDYNTLIREGSVTVEGVTYNYDENTFYATPQNTTAPYSNDYNDLDNKPQLDTTSTTALPTYSNETLTGVKKLHKIAKTGTSTDLVDSADLIRSSDTSSSAQANKVVKYDGSGYLIASVVEDTNGNNLISIGNSGVYVGEMTEALNLQGSGTRPKYNSVELALESEVTSLSTSLSEIIDGTTYVGNATHATSADSATNATNATNANHATSADTATNATNATNAIDTTKINNLELKRDANGVLKIGDTIIPQKILLWSGTATTVDLSPYNLQAGDIIEFVLDGTYHKIKWDGTYTTISCSVSTSNTITSPASRSSILIRNIAVTINTNNGLSISVGRTLDVGYYSDGLTTGNSVKLNYANDYDAKTITSIYKIIE